MDPNRSRLAPDCEKMAEKWVQFQGRREEVRRDILVEPVFMKSSNFFMISWLELL